MYPYLLQGAYDMSDPNQVRARTSAYIPVPGRVPVPESDHGLGQPAGAGVAVVQRRWTPSSAWRALAEALESYGIPEIFNDRSGQPVHQYRVSPGIAGDRGYTLKSMDGRGRCMDNVFIDPGCGAP